MTAPNSWEHTEAAYHLPGRIQSFFSFFLFLFFVFVFVCLFVFQHQRIIENKVRNKTRTWNGQKYLLLIHKWKDWLRNECVLWPYDTHAYTHTHTHTHENDRQGFIVRHFIQFFLLANEMSQLWLSFLPNPSARAGYDTWSIFKRSLTGLNSEFSFS